MSLLYKLSKPFLHKIDAETAHRMTIRAIASGIAPHDNTPVDARLTQTIWGILFPNPVGIAAGFDKNAEAIDGLLNAGFGFVETGTVTPRPQTGNPRPRIFRDHESRSVINRMGFPNEGADIFEKNYLRFKSAGKNANGIIGINIGKNKDSEDAIEDYIALTKRFAHQCDYLTINVSSPNTPGLRDLQSPEFLKPFLAEIQKTRDESCADTKKTPLLLKLAPDLNNEQIENIADVVISSKIDGLILSNTTLDRPESLPEAFRNQMGGLSGPFIREKSTHIIRKFYKLTKGKVPIIGVGGIGNGEQAYEKIKAGASLIQLYTALVYHGPDVIKHIKEDLRHLSRREGFENIADAVGTDTK